MYINKIKNAPRTANTKRHPFIEYRINPRITPDPGPINNAFRLIIYPLVFAVR